MPRGYCRRCKQLIINGLAFPTVEDGFNSVLKKLLDELCPDFALGGHRYN